MAKWVDLGPVAEFPDLAAARLWADAEAATDAKPKAKGVGGRLRAAAERLRGKKDEPEGGSGKKASKPAKGVARKSTTPRKAGGS